MATHRQDRDEALNRLPLPYSVALRLRDAGIDDAVIAECVGVEREGLHSLMLIAEAKLAAAGYHGWTSPATFNPGGAQHRHDTQM